jgi:hypothetical protein
MKNDFTAKAIHITFLYNRCWTRIYINIKHFFLIFFCVNAFGDDERAVKQLFNCTAMKRAVLKFLSVIFFGFI